MAALRTRRPFTAPSEDPTLGDATPAEVLDRSEQSAVVDDLVQLAQRARREYALAGLALTALVLLLLAVLPLPRTVAPPFLARLVALCLVASLARQVYSFRTSASLTPLDALPALPSALVSLLVLRAPGNAQVRLLWGVGPVGAHVLALLLHWEGWRGVRDAEGLRGLMYDAPEA